MVAKVFISYRRDDSAGHAGRVHDRLEREFGRDLLFMDVDAIPLGANFAKVLGEEVAKCDALLAIIGPGWIDAHDEDGRRRLENPHDFVRIEIATALKRDIPVIPVLLEGTRVPKADQLPDDLRELALRNGLDVRHASFHADMDKLIRGLKGERSQQPAPPGPIVIDVSPNGRSKTRAFVPGNGRAEWFSDHPHGPEMVVAPAGSFTRGSPETETQRSADESPQRKVTIPQLFAVGRHAILRGQFAAFVNNTGHKSEGGATVWKGDKWEHDPKGSWRNPGFAQDDSHPVVCINWDDANAYAAWLSDQTRKTYRLLTEAEREYVARAGTTTPFWWGSSITPTQANYNGNYTYAGGGSMGEYRKATVHVGSFAANPWGLFNVHGNVWEWCEDVWHDNYNGAPTDGTAWLQGGDASRRVVRGGSWSNSPQNLRAANRNRSSAGNRLDVNGFRLARTLNP
jgi:formylglycine-generating enzyme required for sulfatase activity